METQSAKVQTAFRLEESLLLRLKRKAKKEQKSLNSLVEEALCSIAPAEPEFPKLKHGLEVSDLVADMMTGILFSEAELAADGRLSYILGK